MVGRLITYIFLVVGIGLIQLWTVIFILWKQDKPYLIAFADGGLFFFCVSLIFTSSYNYLDKGNSSNQLVKIFTIISWIVAFFCMLFFSLDYSDSLKESKPFDYSGQLLMQIGFVVVSIFYSILVEMELGRMKIVKAE